MMLRCVMAEPEWVLIVRKCWCEGSAWTWICPVAVPETSWACVADRARVVMGTLRRRVGGQQRYATDVWTDAWAHPNDIDPLAFSFPSPSAIKISSLPTPPPPTATVASATATLP